MSVKLARMRAALTVFGLVLTLQPAAARHLVHNHHHADGIVRPRAAAPRPLVNYHDTPSYNDPSKSGCCG
jgi:hypothetical protein